jgi:hypothetical protein
MLVVTCFGENTAMFDGVSVAFTDRRLDSPHASKNLPWQLAVLLICCATLSVVLAILYPNVFGTPLEQF